MLNGCFGDAKWLRSVVGVAGEVGLLVTDTLPLMPYFWAIVLNEVCREQDLIPEFPLSGAGSKPHEG